MYQIIDPELRKEVLNNDEYYEKLKIGFAGYILMN